jgi:hypothetical protein
MDIEKNNSEEVLASLKAIFKEYDAIFTSFVSLSSNNIIKSKNKILKHVRLIITDTLSDVILLKKIAGKDNAKYIQIINEIYKRVYDGVILVYNHEFNQLNNVAHTESVVLGTNLAPYISLLSESSKNILNIDCEIKQRLNHSLDVIKQNSNYFHDLKAQIKNRSIGGVFRDFVFGDNKITLLNITESLIDDNSLDTSDVVIEDQRDTIANPNDEKLPSEEKESALDRYSNLK